MSDSPTQTAPLARISAAASPGMITIRADFSKRDVQKAVEMASGCKMPARGQMTTDDAEAALLWMSPDELLLLGPAEKTATDLDSLQEDLADRHALVVDVSDARVLFDIIGAGARDVLAKLAPVDLAPQAFQRGMVRRTRLAQVPAAFWMSDDESFRLLCFRSQAQYVRDLLKNAAASAPVLTQM